MTTLVSAQGVEHRVIEADRLYVVVTVCGLRASAAKLARMPDRPSIPTSRCNRCFQKEQP